MESTLLASELKAHQGVLEKTVLECGVVVDQVIAAIIACFRSGNKLLLCGNGGSAADALHVAGEFVNRFRYDHAALPALALTADPVLLTCIANDSAFENVFSRQVEALAKAGDILVGISTSGNSPDVLKALETAPRLGVRTIAFTGEGGGGRMSSLCDLAVVVPSRDTPRIQECHIFLWHVICESVEKAIFPR